MIVRPVIAAEVLDRLHDRAEAADRDPAWPVGSWGALAAAGVLGWGLPASHGGSPLTRLGQLELYESLAGACLTTAFFLSQRDAAARRLIEHGPPELLDRLLPGLAAGATYVTVGLSQ